MLPLEQRVKYKRKRPRTGRREVSMPVIGRFDEQVARVLIAPIEGTRGETNVPQNMPPRMQEQSGATTEKCESKHDDQTRDRRQPLPVWLL